MTTNKQHILNSMADEAQHIAKTTRIDLDAFLALSSDERSARWRQWDVTAKMDAVIQQIERLGYDWTHELVAEWVAKYDERWALGPVDQAVEGALERLALENADHARAAESKVDYTHFRRNATAYTNALVQYKAGVRPEVLASGARLIPSSTPGKPAHILTMDGDWVCSCKAGASMHWPIALVIGIEVAEDHMRGFDGGDSEEETAAEEVGGSGPEQTPQAAAQPWRIGAVVARHMLQTRLEATAQYVEALRVAQGHTATPEQPRPLRVRLAEARRRSAYFRSAFELSKAA